MPSPLEALRQKYEQSERDRDAAWAFVFAAHDNESLRVLAEHSHVLNRELRRAMR